MGPYCNFCGTRCFCYFPQETPQHILDAYGTSTIIATCQVGQEFEKNKVGYCYNDILEVIEAAEYKQADGALPCCETNTVDMFGNSLGYCAECGRPASAGAR